ncbi:hypothetical protein [Rhodohalobacter sp. SW132]|uniref:hypothetical protein n=1 Tax=Rhodohalobacter sp. SW132 TaxID=2293433 RepID=UPI0011C07146|nr:hypothetical protein [Rhodohalobacter sp. SW132]
MLELEKTPHRNQIISFLLSLGFVFTACMVFLVWSFGIIYIILAIGTGLMVTCGLALIEWRRKNSTLFIYNFWNRLSGLYIRLMNYWLLAVCLRLIFTAVGLAGSDRRFNFPGNKASMWQPRNTVDRDHIGLQYNRYYKRSSRSENWIMDYLNWSSASGNRWQIFLMPFLLLLKIHAPDNQVQSESNNYTLY